jgi:hypothetical protein
MPVYVIFEIPNDLSQDEINAYLYDGDPENKKDEVVPFFRMWDWDYFNEHNSNPGCPYPSDPNYPCSDWPYHTAFGYAQAYWTEQFTKANFVDNAIKGIHGKTSQADATYTLSRWFDTEFRTQHSYLQNNFSSSMYRWWDGTGWTSTGGYCETTATTYAAMLRSAGIPARVFQVDYNKTRGHGESGQFDNTYEYDTSTMMWYGGKWYAQRAYSGASDDGKYYPWNKGVTAITTLDVWSDPYPSPGYYYSDQYGDGVFAVNEDWDFQVGSNAGGTVNQVWPIPDTEWAAINRDYEWDSKLPLEITQSPDVDVLNYLFFNGDNWQPSEWRRPPVSNPTGRNENQTYILPAGVIDPGNPLENWPQGPQPTACSPATPAAECAAFLANWTPETRNYLLEAAANTEDKGQNPIFLPLINNYTSTLTGVRLGKIVTDTGIDNNGDGYFDELVVKFEVISPMSRDIQFGGLLNVGTSKLRGATSTITLKPGKQIVEITFNGMEIANSKANGPYLVEALWAAEPDQTDLAFIDSERTLAYQLYDYSTQAYDHTEFKILAATINSDGISHSGIDLDNNELFESIVIQIPLIIDIQGSFTVDGDLYDGNGDFVGNASWTGIEAEAKLQFNVEKTSPPYSLEHLNLKITNGELLDSRFAPSYEVDDMDGKIQSGNISFGRTSVDDPALAQPLDVDPTGIYTITPVDTDANTLSDLLRVQIGVTVTGVGGNYRVEGLLEDEHGTEVAWAVSDPQPLLVGNQTMTLDFDGKMLYDQLPLSGTRAFKLVAVKIFSGNLSVATLESEAKFATVTPAYARNQFEPSSPAVTLFQDDLETGTSKWSADSNWGINSTIWNSWEKSWATTDSGSLSLAAPIDFSDYAGPVLHFEHAYRFGSVNDKVELKISTDSGSTWDSLKTFSGNDTTPHWLTENIDLSAFGEISDVRLRFEATRATTNGLLWYMDDIFINAWPAIKTASFTFPSEIMEGVPATFTASYSSIDTSIPVTYTWNFNTEEIITTDPTVNLTFADDGDVAVTLTVSSAYDSATTTETITVIPKPDQAILIVDIIPGAGGTVTRNPDQVAYDFGTEVTLTAVPNTGYTFSSWGGGGCSGIGTCVVTMDGDTTVTATFAINTYNLNYTAGANGTLSGETSQIVNHGSNGTAVTAVPNTGYHFVNWSDGSLVNPRMDTNVTGNISVTANFAINTYTLNYTAGPNGSISGVTTQTVNHGGDGSQVEAIPNTGYHFVNWSDGSFTNPRTDKTVTENITVTANFAINTYSLNYTAGPNGSLSGNTTQTVNHGASGSAVTANAATGYHFVDWSDASTENPRTDENVTGDISVTANFAINTYTLQYNAGTGGTLSGNTSQTVDYGADGTTVEAVPDTGYYFVNWSDGSTDNPRTDENVTGDISVTANFAIHTYTLNYSAGTGGTLSGNTSQTVDYGADGTAVEAVPDTGYYFVNWSDGSTENPRTDENVTGDISVTANFAIHTYTLNYSAGTGGTLSGDTSQTVDYGADGTAVLAIPNTGYYFVEWSDGSTENPRTDENVTGDISVTANFAIYTYTLQYSAGPGGTLSGNTSQTVDYGADGTAVTAVANTGYYFVNWSDGSTENPRTDTKVMADISVTANFAIHTYTLNYSAGSGGTLSGDTSQTVDYGANGTAVLAIPDTGYYFVNWSDSSTENPRTDENVTGDISVTANFAIHTYTLHYSAGTGGTLSGDTSQTVDYGANGTAVLAVPNTGYYFVEWSDGSTENPRTDTNVMADISVTANFAIYTYTLHYSAGTGGTLSGNTSQTVDYGTDGTAVEAVPDAGYYFVEWSDGSNDNPRTDTNVTADISVTAKFELVPPECFALTVTHTGMGTTPVANPTNSVGCEQGTYQAGENISLSGAAADTGWQISSWMGTKNNNSTAMTNSVTMPASDHTTGVNYTQITYLLTVVQSTGGWITPETAEYVFGEVVSLMATPQTGYFFVEWTGACSGIGTCSVHMDADKTVSAVFEEYGFTIYLPLVINGGSETANLNPDSLIKDREMVVSVFADSGWLFKGWRGNCFGSIQSCLPTSVENIDSVSGGNHFFNNQFFREG